MKIKVKLSHKKRFLEIKNNEHFMYLFQHQ